MVSSSGKHRTGKYLNNRIEQEHRDIKRRYGPTLGFQAFDCAAIFCPAVDETRQLFRARKTVKENISLSQCRQHSQQSVTEFRQVLASCPLADAQRTVKAAA